MSKSLDNLLGLAQRAGKIVSGDAAIKAAVARGQAKLVLIAADASQRTAKEYQQLCVRYNVSWVLVGNKLALGLAIGKSRRSAIAFLDHDFTRGVLKLLERGE